MQSIYDTIDVQKEHHSQQSISRLPFETKINVVLMNGINDDEIGDFVELTRNNPINVRFIEFMPFNDNKWNHNKFIAYRTALEQICADPRFQDGGATPLSLLDRRFSRHREKLPGTGICW